MAAVINLFIDLCLVRSLGIFAAAISTLVASVFLYFYRDLHVRNYVRFLSIKDAAYILSFICLIYVFYVNKELINIIVFVVSIIIAVILNYKMVYMILAKTMNKILRSHRWS